MSITQKLEQVEQLLLNNPVIQLSKEKKKEIVNLLTTLKEKKDA